MPSLPFESHGTGSPVVWLHGFTQTRKSAHTFRTILAENHAVTSLDLPGHGDAHDVRANLAETATLVRDAYPAPLTALGGYSMGGRVALHAALQDPSRISTLVLLGATRGIATPNDRRNRVLEDEARAARIETVGVDQFLDEWLQLPLFATLPPDSDERESRSRSGEGLAASLRLCGTGSQEFLGGQLHRLTMPVLLLAGALDEKFAGEAFEMALELPNAHVALVPEAGHAAHLERPRYVGDVVTEFLSA